MEDYLVSTLEWLKEATNKDKFDFLHDIFSTIKKLEDINSIQNLINKRKRKIKTIINNVTYRELNDLKHSSSEKEPVPTVPVPDLNVQVLPKKKKFVKKEWFRNYSYSNFVALDAEFVNKISVNGVDLKDMTLKERKHILFSKIKISDEWVPLFKHLAKTRQLVRTLSLACVGISDFYGNLIYFGRVSHDIYTFEVNRYTKNINGFGFTSLVEGDNFETVKMAVIKQIQNKLIILCGGKSDINVLELFNKDLDIFELQDHYYTYDFNNNGKLVREPIGLKRLMKTLFGKEVQNGVHCPIDDAKNTMKVFKEHYAKNGNMDRYVNNGYSYKDFPL